MAFGRNDSAARESKVWRADEKSARELNRWARDGALLPYFQATPPHRDAAPGSPEATWRAHIRIALPDGQGEQWIPVPTGSTITKSGTDADPTFTVRTPRQQAETFTE